MTFGMLLIGLVLGLLLGGGAAWVFAQRRAEAERAATGGAQMVAAQAHRRELEAAVAAARADEALRTTDVMAHQQQAAVAQAQQQAAEARAAVEQQAAAAQATVRQLQEQLVDLQAQHRDYVEAMRAERVERTQQQGLQEAGQTQVLTALAPVTAQLHDMQQKVAEMEQQRATQHGQLAEQIRATQVGVAESRKAADSLAHVLRNNNAVRGAWGEAQLRNLVESAGLLNRVDFELQRSMTADSGARRPDMVINLPGGKQMAIDAKVPYNAFMDAQRDGLDPIERERLLQEHARRVRGHIDALAGKGYWTGLQSSPEFTIAFIPNDQILNAALEIDPSLLDHAFRSAVPLATPTNLYSMLKTIAFTWKQEALTEDAQRLFALGQELYRRITTMAQHVEKLGRSLTTSVKDYNKFVGSLERQVLVSARKINAADATALVPAPTEIEEPVRALTAGDFELFSDLDRPELDLDLAIAVEAEIVDGDEHGEAV
jgi:DNA recombination protein RmuC